MKPKLRRAVTCFDVLAVLLVIALLAPIGLAQFAHARETANRIKCASNLRQIGQALLLYSNENGQNYPRTAFDVDAADRPTFGTPYLKNKDLGADDKADPFAADKDGAGKFAPDANDVSAALYLLLRTEDITSDVFVCPAYFGGRWDFGGGGHNSLSWTNWAGAQTLRESLNYSYQNPYPSKDAISTGFKFNNSLAAEFAVAADLNPGIAAVTKANLRTGSKEMKAANSLNHDGDGQNVLFGDGHVEWTASPFTGPHHDNIYSYGPSGDANADTGGSGISGSSVDANDSVLLPTAKDFGLFDEKDVPVPGLLFTPPVGKQVDDLFAKLVGKFTGGPDGKTEIEFNKAVVKTTADDQPTARMYSIVGMSGDRARVNIDDAKVTIIFTKVGIKLNGARPPFADGEYTKKK